MTFKIIPKLLVVYFIRSIREYFLDNNITVSSMQTRNVRKTLIKMGVRKIPKTKKLERILCFISHESALKNNK